MYHKLIQEIEKNRYDVHGIEFFQNGQVVFEHFFHDNKRYPVYSATKSFTSTAVGFAVLEGKMSVKDKISAYLTKDEISKVPLEKREAFCKLPIKRFLTMSILGYPFRPEGNDYMASSLQCETADYEASPQFSYSNIPAYLVGVACQRAVGKHLISYLKPRLFEPLGISNVEYVDSPEGHFYGATGMQLTVKELRSLGQLYLQNGQWEGQEILPKEWICEATAKHIENREGGYGYYFWRRKDGYLISGKWGQKCIVIPDKNLIVTYMSHMPEGAGQVAKLVERMIEKI